MELLNDRLHSKGIDKDITDVGMEQFDRNWLDPTEEDAASLVEKSPDVTYATAASSGSSGSVPDHYAILQAEV